MDVSLGRNELRKSFASLITKGGFLEAGVLTNPDIERALGSLPTASSTKEEIEIGFRVLDEIMTTAQRRFEMLKSGKSFGVEQQQSKMSKVIMKDPNGISYEVDNSEAEEALKHGWTK